MKKTALYAIIAVVVAAAGVGVAFAAMSSMNSNNTEAANQQQTSTEPRVIKHTMGEAEITGTPQRIVALEWTYAEDLLALVASATDVTVAAAQKTAVLSAEIGRTPLIRAGVQQADAAAGDQDVELILGHAAVVDHLHDHRLAVQRADAGVVAVVTTAGELELVAAPTDVVGS